MQIRDGKEEQEGKELGGRRGGSRFKKQKMMKLRKRKKKT